MAPLATTILPVYERLTGRRFWSMGGELRRLQWQPAEVLEARALDRARRILGHAVRHVPHYRDMLARHGVEPASLGCIADLARVPELDRGRLVTHAADLLAEGVPAGRRRRLRTSGSTGSPMEFFQDQAEVDPQWASLLLFQDWAGIATSDARVVVTGRVPANVELARWTRVPTWARRGLLGSRTLSLPGVDASAERLRILIGRLPATRRYHLVAYSSYAARLAREILDGGPAPSVYPSVVICGGETLAAGEAGLIARAFRCPVVSRYSAWEATFLAQTCPDAPPRLHVNTERAVLRVVRDDGADARPGETGRVLVTNLWNEVMPLINYDIGDRATSGGSCPCGRGFPTLDAIDGRATEVIRTMAGNLVSPAALCNFLTFEHPVVGSVAEFQAVQTTPDRVILRVRPTPQFSATTAAALRQALGALLGPGMDVEIQPVDRVPTLPSGKRRLIVSLEAP